MPKAEQKFLIWDFDGTLAWRPGGWAGALVNVLKRRAPHLGVTADQVRPYLQAGFPWHAPEIVHTGLSPQEWWEDLIPVFVRAFRGVGIENGQAVSMAFDVRSDYITPVSWQRFPDALPALEDLTRRGWSHILLTNHIPELPFLLEHLGLYWCFTGIFNSAQTGYEKPNLKAFRTVLDWIGKAANATVVGDSFTADILGAREAGLPAILVRNPHPEAVGYSATLAGVGELL